VTLRTDSYPISPIFIKQHTGAQERLTDLEQDGGDKQEQDEGLHLHQASLSIKFLSVYHLTLPAKNIYIK
jgi:hypothetical protein